LRFAADLERERPLDHLEFLQVELDAHHEPTYGFVPGVAVTSLAAKTAERLGVTREALQALVNDKRATRLDASSTTQNSELTSLRSPASSPSLKPAWTKRTTR
jgi:hypothetical protein